MNINRRGEVEVTITGIVKNYLRGSRKIDQRDDGRINPGKTTVSIERFYIYTG